MKKKLLAIALILSSVTACDILNPDPADTGQVFTETFYVDFNGALQGVNGIYNTLYGVYGNIWVMDVMSDDTQSGPGGDQNAVDFELQSIQPTSGQVSALWSSSYSGIYRANVFIDRVPNIALQGNQAVLRDQFLGEAHYLRALHYFNLVRLFGGVPLITSEIKSTEALSIPRNSVAEIYAQIEKDLKDAIRYLPARHPNPNLVAPIIAISGGQEVGRATSGSAKTMLADLYLTMGQRNAEAETLLREVVNSGVYSLVSNYASNFAKATKNNAESVFEVQYGNPNARHDFSFQFGPEEDAAGGVKSLSRNRPTDKTLPESGDLNNALVQAFEAGDARLAASVGYSPGTATARRSIANKYYVANDANMGTVNWRIYRYADVLLLLAEALQNQGKDDLALIELKKVRDNARTGLAPLGTLTGTALRDAIRRERRVELNTEAKRWFDLRRWGILEATMSAHGRTVKANTGGLLPIPQGEINKNNKLIQNPGY